MGLPPLLQVGSKEHAVASVSQERDGHVVGAIGVGSGTSAQDVEVAKAALEAIGAQEKGA